MRPSYVREEEVDVLKGAKDNSQERDVKRKRKDHGRHGLMSPTLT